MEYHVIAMLRTRLKGGQCLRYLIPCSIPCTLFVTVVLLIYTMKFAAFFMFVTVL